MAQHLSIRVPWKDNGYDGRVCAEPCRNNACLRLNKIASAREDSLEKKLAGCTMKGHEDKLIYCMTEGGAFMSAESHSHKTSWQGELEYPPFSLPAIPYRWISPDKDNIGRLATYGIPYNENLEENSWNRIEALENQRPIYARFYRDVKQGESLVLPYAMQVPFIEDSKRRVVMGVGFVKSVKLPPRFESGKPPKGWWESMIGHSIRKDRKEGFLLPYWEMMEYAEAHPDFDMSSVAVFVEDGFSGEFSNKTEWLSCDAVISVLLRVIKVLGIVKECIPDKGNWDECIVWASNRLAEAWKDRRVFPGVGIMLLAMGFTNGMLIAEEVYEKTSEGDSFRAKLEQAIAEPDKLSQEIAESISKNKIEQDAFIELPQERKTLFWLLSRLSLTSEQASALFLRGYSYFYYDKKKKQLVKAWKKVDIGCSDAEMLTNPYLIYEKTRLLKDKLQIPLRRVDMAVFPPKEIQQEIQRHDPLPEPSNVSAVNDMRRIRAIAISVLERQTGEGHTVYPQSKLIIDINELPLDPYCSVSDDILNLKSLRDYFSAEIVPIEMKNGGTAYQLVRMKEFDDIIRQSVDKRINSTKRHQIPEDWNKIVNQEFDKNKPIEEITDDNEHEREMEARKEKAAALKELAEARLSVLIGGAGTGKTTLLALLCKSQLIRDGGVLLLAPTGKARVRMSQAMNEMKQDFEPEAKTIAQFLLKSERFDIDTMRYQLSDKDAEVVPDTVIIDECSMLTEEMFGALIQALKKNAQRIILVGDPKQLPPIGAGRPFVDLVYHLQKDIPAFPRVGKSFCELTVNRRQRNKDGTERFDSILAEWYSDTEKELDDDIFTKLQTNQCGPNIAFKTWETPEKLEQLILETVAEELGMEDLDDLNKFNQSLGGTILDEYVYFNPGCAAEAEKWQILAPIKNMPHGVLNINQLLHTKYRKDFIKRAKHKIIPQPMGAQGIVYGDKVINTQNGKRDAWPQTKDAINYVANGEIGIASGISNKLNKYPERALHVNFSSQQRYTYSYGSADFGEESDALELAYALTVHKAQGSEFGSVILVISEPCPFLLSRELLYTAITRQKDRLVILYNDKAYKLRKYASAEYSVIARRFTNLFEKPEIKEYKKKFFEEHLIHRTARGELVRSKSEVIIADALFDKGVDYSYEKELSLGEDGIRSPDFTIEDAESGNTFYWEHCGMMSDAKYRSRWEAKRALYEKHGIVEGKNLIVSEDKADGGIDSQEIRELISKYLV